MIVAEKENKVVKWSEVLTIKNGKNQRKVENPKGKYPIYGSGGVMGYADDYICDEHTVIIGRKGSINNPLYILEKFWNVDTAFGLVAGKNLSSKYLYYFCVQYDFLKHNKATTIPSLTKADLLKIEIPLPPLKTQKRIAKILDEASSLRDKTQQLLKEYDLLTQAIFLDMFGDPITNPKGWKKIPMGKLMTILRGGSPRPIKNYLEGKYPWIKIGDATKGDDIYIHSTKQKITEAGLSKTRLLPIGSLIFANCGVSLGFARIIKFQGCIHDGWLAFSGFDEIINKFFILKALNNITQYFRDTAPDGTQPNLNIGIMKNFELIVPPLIFQNEFEEKINLIVKQKTLAKQELKESEDLFNCLLQKAFKGELV